MQKVKAPVVGLLFFLIATAQGADKETLTQLNSSDWTERKLALEKGQVTLDDPELAPLVRAALGDENERIRFAATAALGRSKAAEAETLAARATKDASPRVRAEALAVLARRKSPLAKDALIAALRSPEDAGAAAPWIAAYPGADTGAALTEAWLSGATSGAPPAKAVEDAMAAFPDDWVRAPLVASLETSPPPRRALTEIGRRRLGAADAKLVAALKDADGKVDADVAEALRAVRGKETFRDVPEIAAVLSKIPRAAIIEHTLTRLYAHGGFGREPAAAAHADRFCHRATRSPKALVVLEKDPARAAEKSAAGDFLINPKASPRPPKAAWHDDLKAYEGLEAAVRTYLVPADIPLERIAKMKVAELWEIAREPRAVALTLSERGTPLTFLATREEGKAWHLTPVKEGGECRVWDVVDADEDGVPDVALNCKGYDKQELVLYSPGEAGQYGRSWKGASEEN